MNSRFELTKANTKGYFYYQQQETKKVGNLQSKG